VHEYFKAKAFIGHSRSLYLFGVYFYCKWDKLRSLWKEWKWVCDVVHTLHGLHDLDSSLEHCDSDNNKKNDTTALVSFPDHVLFEIVRRDIEVRMANVFPKCLAIQADSMKSLDHADDAGIVEWPDEIPHYQSYPSVYHWAEVMRTIYILPESLWK
jgi:hypothetical protein